MVYRKLFLTFIILTAIAVNTAFARPDSFADIVEKTRAGVVHISIYKQVSRGGGGSAEDEMIRKFFGDDFERYHQWMMGEGDDEGDDDDDGMMGDGNGGGMMDKHRSDHGGKGGKGDKGDNDKEKQMMGLGSGFIISKDGFIITNYHVVEHADNLTVTLLNKEQYEAKVIGVDPLVDLALIKIEPKQDLTVLPIGDSDKVRIGDWVLAIGNPLGLDWTVTAGILSARGREIGEGPYDDFLQTDALINFGNSGGPLLNVDGEVIGINTAISSEGQGLDFAIPSKMLVSELDSLRKGNVQHGWIGIGLQDIDDQLQKAFKLPNKNGVIVTDVMPNNPAANASLKSGDVITRIDGKDTNDASDLRKIVGALHPGDKVKVEYYRQGKASTATMVIGARDDGRHVAQNDNNGQEKKDKQKSEGDIGVSALDKDVRKKLGIDSGVKVINIKRSSSAYRSGLEVGDIILSVNGKDIQTESDFSKAYDSIKSGDVVNFRIVRGGGVSVFLAFTK